MEYMIEKIKINKNKCWMEKQQKYRLCEKVKTCP